MQRLPVIVIAAGLAAAPFAFAQQTAPAPQAQQAAQRPAAPPAFDAAAVLGPPPAANTAAQAADTLALLPATTPERLARARADQPFSPYTVMQPVFGDAFTEARLPATKRVLDAVVASLISTGAQAKTTYNRTRPYAVDRRVLQCDDPGPMNGSSPSYPSTHAALGWATALVLAELAPQRTGAILLRGREFGDSRVICGFHYPSDIEAGRVLAAGVVARLHADAGFRRDLEAARREIARAYPN